MTREGMWNDLGAGELYRLITRRAARRAERSRVFSAGLVVVVGLLIDMNAVGALGTIPGDAASAPFDEETTSYSKAKDTKGRSLHQFDLATRLFKYPCSYLIYSDAFDALPRQLKETLYQRLWDILTGRDTSPAFARIPAETRQAIIEILIETKKELPSYWKRKA